jgi:hypothetical protein
MLFSGAEDGRQSRSAGACERGDFAKIPVDGRAWSAGSAWPSRASGTEGRERRPGRERCKRRPGRKRREGRSGPVRTARSSWSCQCNTARCSAGADPATRTTTRPVGAGLADQFGERLLFGPSPASLSRARLSPALPACARSAIVYAPQNAPQKQLRPQQTSGQDKFCSLHKTDHRGRLPRQQLNHASASNWDMDRDLVRRLKVRAGSQNAVRNPQAAVAFWQDPTHLAASGNNRRDP